MDLGMSREVQVSISMPSSNIQDAQTNRIHHQIYSTKAFGIVEGMCTPTPAIYHHANEVNRPQPHHVPEMTNVVPPPRSRDEIRPHHMPEMTNVTPPRPREEIRPHHVPETVNAVPPKSRDEIRPHHMADTLNAVPPRSRDEIRPHTHQQQHNSSQTLHVQHFVVSQAPPPPPPQQQENNTHVTPTATRSNDKAVKYRECRKNHAASIGGYAVDGCGEFMPSGEEGTSGSLKCAACSCHRNFHRREVEGEVRCDCHHAMIRRSRRESCERINQRSLAGKLIREELC